MRLAFSILFASCLVAVAAPAPIQHNPWTTTTNDPSVTLQAQQPVSITTTSNISLEAPSLIKTTNTVNGALNILAKGGDNTGTSVNDAAFAAAIAQLSATTNGGTIYLPSGIYLISTPITLTANCLITIWGEGSMNSEAISGSIIRLASGANTDMLVKPNGKGLNLRHLIFDGNKSAQTATNLHGLWLVGDDRVGIEDVAVGNVSGVGIQNDNRESRFARVYVWGCLFDGIQNTASSDVAFTDILSGFNGGAGLYCSSANSFRIVRGDFYRNQRGMVLLNANNNDFFGVKLDANEREGLLLTSVSPQFSYQNRFVSCSFNDNNFILDHTGATSSVPSGTYSNVKVDGNNTIENHFIACHFWENEPAWPANLPKFEFEDVRPNYVSAGSEGAQLTFTASSFKSTTNYSTAGAYSTNFIHAAIGTWFVDGNDTHKDRDSWYALSLAQLFVNDQIQAGAGLQVSSLYTNGAWQFSVPAGLTNYAYYLRARPDNELLALQYAGKGTNTQPLTWTSGLTISTNGSVGINIGDTAARQTLEVGGNIKGSLFEGDAGTSFNAYYDGGWKYRANGPAFYIQPAASGTDLLLNIAVSGVANAAVTWIPSLRILPSGAATMPSLTLDTTLAATTVNGGSVNSTNVFRSNGTPGVNAVIWTNVISGVITQQFICTGGIITSVTTLP